MILERPDEPGKPFAMAFTLMVHAGLIAALFFGVQWKRSKPEVMEVELWSARPVPAVVVEEPPPEPVVKPEPKPIPKIEPEPPKKPDIVIKEKKPNPEAQIRKPEVKPPPKVPDFSKELSRETSELKPRMNNNARQMANAAAAESAQRASANNPGKSEYSKRISGKIRGNIVLPPNIQGNPEAVFDVNQLPTGEVLAVKLKYSSGNQALDTAIERAIWKSSPLPKPDNLALFERDLVIRHRPFEE